MAEKKEPRLTDLIGRIPYRLALAGGWIDQPFVSQHNPSPPGSMVVVNIEPEFRFMDRAGICGSTRSVALKLWGGKIPENRNRDELVRELYEAENEGKVEPSGSQDMIGLIYPGVNRLDYDYKHNRGVYPCHIESNNDPKVAEWLSRVIHILTVMPRPEGYNPLGVKNLDPKWVRRLGQAGKDCFDAIVRMDTKGFGESLNENMRCWEVLLPQNFKHPLLTLNLLELLDFYQRRYAGAMYSGCGGGYLYVISEEPVPGAFRATVKVRK